MSQSRLYHSTLVRACTLPASPERVFNVMTQPVERGRMLASSGAGKVVLVQAGLGVSGRDVLRYSIDGSPKFELHMSYLDVAPLERIVSVDTIYQDDERLAFALTTIEISRISRGTHVKILTHAAWIEGSEETAGADMAYELVLSRLETYLSDD